MRHRRVMRHWQRPKADIRHRRCLYPHPTSIYQSYSCPPKQGSDASASPHQTCDQATQCNRSVYQLQPSAKPVFAAPAVPPLSAEPLPSLIEPPPSLTASLTDRPSPLTELPPLLLAAAPLALPTDPRLPEPSPPLLTEPSPMASLLATPVRPSPLPICAAIPSVLPSPISSVLLSATTYSPKPSSPTIDVADLKDFGINGNARTARPSTSGGTIIP